MTTKIVTRACRFPLSRPTTVGSAVLCISSALAAGALQAETAVGLTNTNQLAIFDTAMPGNASALVSISGLQTNEVLLGIDYRPSTGVLYALGSSSRLYTLQAASGTAAFVASLSELRTVRRRSRSPGALTASISIRFRISA